MSLLIEEGEKAVRGELTIDEMKQWLETFKTRSQIKRALELELGETIFEEPNASPPTLNEEIRKLTALGNELKARSEKIEHQIAEMRELLMQVVKAEKSEKPAAQEGKKARALQ
jgi:hypothetical protein